MSKTDSKALHRELPSLASEIRALVGEDDKLPPVHLWHPEREGEIDILIDAEGDWHYQGDKMERESVVRLLSRILRKEGLDYFLVTPVEKMKISVVDVPFIVGMMDVEGQGDKQSLHFSTRTGDYFTLGPEHPLQFVASERGESTPYVTVRGELLARLSRPVYYELAELAMENGSALGVWSQGQFFSF